jgi:hypothetical protein
MNTPSTARIIAAALSVLFNYMTYIYLEKFEKLSCGCSMDIRRDIAKVMLLSFYAIVVGQLFYPDIPITARMLILVYTLVFDVVFISYIFYLRNTQCVCDDVSQDATTSIIYIYYSLMTFVFVASILMLVLLSTFGNLYVKKK